MPQAFPAWLESLHLAGTQFSIFKIFLSLQACHEARSITVSERLYYWGGKCHANTIVIINNFFKSVEGSDIINCNSSTCSVCVDGNWMQNRPKGFLLLIFLHFWKKWLFFSWDALNQQETSQLCKSQSLSDDPARVQRWRETPLKGRRGLTVWKEDLQKQTLQEQGTNPPFFCARSTAFPQMSHASAYCHFSWELLYHPCPAARPAEPLAWPQASPSPSSMWWSAGDILQRRLSSSVGSKKP